MTPRTTTASTTRRLVAVLVALTAGLGLALVGAAPGPAQAETAYVTPKGRFVKVVDVQRTDRRLSLTSQVKDHARKDLIAQDWGIDTDGEGRAELLASWFKGERTARLYPLQGQGLPGGCRRLDVVQLPRHRGATIEVPGRCLSDRARQPRQVRVAHDTVVQAGDSCQVQSVPKKGYLGPLGTGAGEVRTSLRSGLSSRGTSGAKGC